VAYTVEKEKSWVSLLGRGVEMYIQLYYCIAADENDLPTNYNGNNKNWYI
jgi:hypothetical protein